MTELSRFVHIRRDLHRIPELGFKEYKTQKYLLNYIEALPQEHLEVKTWRTGIFVRVKGTEGKRTLGYRADIDGLPIREQTGLSFASEHEGYMHACGHDLHMSIALGILTHFSQNPARDHLLFIFQPAEEGPGGAAPMVQSEIMQKWRPDIVIGLHIAPEYPAGTIAVKEGILFANTSEVIIDLKGKGGHAAYPHKANDMVVAAAHLVTQLQSIIARNIDPLDSAVVTIGKITGGTILNIISETARLEGTIRTFSAETMSRIKERIEALSSGIETGFDCSVNVHYPAAYYQVFNDEHLTKEFMSFIESDPDVRLYKCREAMTGEDFGYMLKEISGFMFWLGVNSEHGLHHAGLQPDESAIDIAIQTMIRYFTYKQDH